MKKVVLLMMILTAVLLSSCVMTDNNKVTIDISKDVSALNALRPDYPPDYPDPPAGRSQEEVYSYLYGVIAAQEECLSLWHEYALAREKYDSKLVEILKSY